MNALLTFIASLHEPVTVPCGHCGVHVLRDCASLTPDVFGAKLPSCEECADLYYAELDHEHDRDDAPPCNSDACSRLRESVSHLRLVGMYSRVERFAEQAWISEDGGN